MSAREFTIRFGLFVGGAAVGTAVALLTAPKTGKQTRKALSRGFEDGVDYLNGKSKAVTRQVETVLDKGRGLASKLAA
jgi:gas vesicle protein